MTIRADILDTVVSFPGCTAAEIAEEIHAHLTTVRTDLIKLRRAARLRSSPDPLKPRRHCWYPAT